MNKGEQLGILLDQADAIHKEMRQIFIKQGLGTPDLSLLSSDDREEWNRLYEESKKVADEISELINE